MTETTAEAAPTRVPRVWVLYKGGIKVAGEDGITVSVRLLPREMRALAKKLVGQAGFLDGEQPTRVGDGTVDD